MPRIGQRPELKDGTFVRGEDIAPPLTDMPEHGSIRTQREEKGRKELERKTIHGRTRWGRFGESNEKREGTALDNHPSHNECHKTARRAQAKKADTPILTIRSTRCTCKDRPLTSTMSADHMEL